MVSVCMPVRNGMPYIQQAIESVINQTYQNWELIICDNGSTDESLTVARDLAAKNSHKNIRVIPYTEVCGMAENWNRTMEQATGKYIKVLPCDDNLRPDCLQLQAEALEKHSNCGLALSGKTIIDATGRMFFSRIAFADQEINYVIHGRKCLTAYGKNLFGEPGGGLFKRELVSLVGAYDGSFKYYTDIEFWFRIMKQAPARFIAQPLYEFRIHGNGTTRRSRDLFTAEYIRFLELYAGDFHLSNLRKRWLVLGARFTGWARSMVINYLLARGHRQSIAKS